ncbi:hypothetical protein [Archangium primigenium]|uniref:hypothetical protein n=1 Tax=[Archangium] primigenium TaxID=2792470 RepID=UPI00195DF8CF|nr:hypothetical protein [Archangium primigenium]MBM7119499.1 hypothetical protein [Archangium primigenium]
MSTSAWKMAVVGLLVGCGGAELDARSPEALGALEQHGGSTSYATPPTSTQGTQTYTRTGLTEANCTVTQQIGRSLDGTRMYSYCVTTCKSKTAINMHNTLYNNQLAGQIVCGSSTAGGLDRTSQSVECSGPYTPGGYSDSCFVDIYFKNQGQYASGTTPTWQF